LHDFDDNYWALLVNMRFVVYFCKETND
jgi:hypothetical protein